MARRFLTNIDLTKNELQNVVIHKLAAAPGTPVEGQIYYNTADERWYLRQNSAWKDVTGSIDSLTAGSTAVALTDNADGTWTIDINLATGAVKGAMSSTDKTKLDGATSANTVSTLVARDASGDFAAGRVTVDDITITNTPSAGTDGANKDYVDGLVTGLLDLQGGIDASANPNYPAAVVGDTYYITVDGLIGGVSGTAVEVGDSLICVVDSAAGDEGTVGANWIILQNNDLYATETAPGNIEIATQAEVDAEVDAVRAVTPLTMAAYVAANGGGGGAATYAENIGDAAALVFIVNHALASSDVHVQVNDTSTLDIVEPDIVITDANNVTITFNVAPALNAYRVVVLG